LLLCAGRRIENKVQRRITSWQFASRINPSNRTRLKIIEIAGEYTPGDPDALAHAFASRAEELNSLRYLTGLKVGGYAVQSVSFLQPGRINAKAGP
jgi:hypothetical protein